MTSSLLAGARPSPCGQPRAVVAEARPSWGWSGRVPSAPAPRPAARTARCCRSGRRCRDPRRGRRAARSPSRRRGRRRSSSSTSLARQARIAVGIEQHRLRRDQRALAVERRARRPRPRAAPRRRASPSSSGEPRRQLRVVRERRVLAAPGVEAELHGGDAAVAVDDEDRPVVAHPGVVDRELGRRRSGCACPTGSRGRRRAARSRSPARSARSPRPRRRTRPAPRPGCSPHRSARHGHETNVRACSTVLLGTNNASSRGLGTMASSASGRVARTVSAALDAAPILPDTRGMSERADVVVIGGGLFGTSIAYQLCRARRRARRPARARHARAAATPGRTFGMVRRHYSNAVTALLAMRGSSTIINWAEEIGIGDSGYVETGYLLPVPEALADACRDNVARLAALGLDTSFVGAGRDRRDRAAARARRHRGRRLRARRRLRRRAQDDPRLVRRRPSRTGSSRGSAARRRA